MKENKVKSNWKAKKLAASQVLLLSTWQTALPHCVTKIYRTFYRQKKINPLHIHMYFFPPKKMNLKLLIRPAGWRMLTQSSIGLHQIKVFVSNGSQMRTLCFKEKQRHIGWGKLTHRSALPSHLGKDTQRGTNKHHMLYLTRPGCPTAKLQATKMSLQLWPFRQRQDVPLWEFLHRLWSYSWRRGMAAQLPTLLTTLGASLCENRGLCYTKHYLAWNTG